MKDYLLYGIYNEGWGTILLKIAMQNGFLGPEEIYTIVHRINQWGYLLKHLESNYTLNIIFLLSNQTKITNQINK